MQLFVDEGEAREPTAPGVLEGREALELGAAGARLRVLMAKGERLTGLALEIRRRAEASPPAPAIELSFEDDPDKKGSWAVADWGGALAVRRVVLQLEAGPAVELRIRIARGTSSWYAPPGRHTFDISKRAKAGPFEATFADTVADRVMFEFFEPTTSTPEAVGFAAKDPITLSFGAHAGHPRLRLAGGRELFAFEGAPRAGQAVETGELVDAIAEQAPVEDGEFTLELSVGIGGHLELGWRLGYERVIRELPVATVELAELEVRELELARADSTQRLHPSSLELSCLVDLDRLRLRLAPPPGPPSRALAELARPLFDNAQAFCFEPPEARALSAVDLWVTPRGDDRVEARLTLEASLGGRPSGVALAEVGASLDSGAPPGWLRFELPEPVALPHDRWWLVLTVDAGELAWTLAPRTESLDGVGEPRYRRNQGEWLSREARLADHWALTRLWVHEPEPEPLSTSLSFDGARDIELVPDADGVIRWGPEAEAENEAAWATKRLSLRLRTEARARVSLSGLELHLREEAGG